MYNNVVQTDNAKILLNNHILITGCATAQPRTLVLTPVSECNIGHCYTAKQNCAVE